MFYEIIVVFTYSYMGILPFLVDIRWLLSCLQMLAFNVVTVSLSFAMYLMMEHNESEYIKFLKLIYHLKLHFCCCRCRFIVMEQLEDLDKDVKQISVGYEGSKDMTPASHETIEPEKLNVNGMELSIETTKV